MIADNRLTETSAWDDRLLAESLKELSELELDFSIEATGFTMGEIDLRIEGLSTTGDDEPDMADRLPTPTSQFAISKSGDLWHLGRHSVLCGSALSEESFRALLGIKRAHMVFADPPYNIPIQGNTSGHGRIQYREFSMAVGELDAVEFTSFLTRCCALMAKYSIDGSIHFLCMDWRHVAELLEAGRLAYACDGGYCLVFDTKGLEALMEEEQSAYLYWYMALSEVHYFTDAQSLPPSFFELVDKSKDIIDAVLRREDFSVTELFTPFVTSAVSIKHPGFAEEREVQLVAMAATKLTDDKMKGTSGYVSLLIKYIFTCERDSRKRHHISLFGPERSKLPLVKVIVGPARDQRRNAVVAHETVGRGIEVVQSKTPLVG